MGEDGGEGGEDAHRIFLEQCIWLLNDVSHDLPQVVIGIVRRHLREKLKTKTMLRLKKKEEQE